MLCPSSGKTVHPRAVTSARPHHPASQSEPAHGPECPASSHTLDTLCKELPALDTHDSVVLPPAASEEEARLESPRDSRIRGKIQEWSRSTLPLMPADWTVWNQNASSCGEGERKSSGAQKHNLNWAGERWFRLPSPRCPRLAAGGGQASFIEGMATFPIEAGK